MGEIAQAAERLARYRLNELVTRQSSSVLVQIGRLLVTPLVGILRIASVVSGVMGQTADSRLVDIHELCVQ